MKYEWILDVLADLNAFAELNGLEALAHQLEDTRRVASTEISARREMAGLVGNGKEAAAGDYTRGPQ